MNQYRNTKALMSCLAGTLILLSACQKDPDPDPVPDLPRQTLILNSWIFEGMHQYYLWEQFMPNLNPKTQPDSRAYFYDLLYEADRNSWIVDDYESLAASFDGVQLSTGISASPGLVGDNEVITIVEYVTPNSPAADSGIDRGDIIYAVDGQTLDTLNYNSLYFQMTATLEFADWDGTRIVPNGRKVTLTAIELNQNPVVHREVIEYQGQKIGYFVYTQFTPGPNDEWMQELDDVFEDFRSQGVTDVVVDLRYNGGGYLYLSAYIASALGSATAMQSRKIFVKEVWNEELTDYWKNADLDNDGNPDGEDSEQLVIRFPNNDFNLNLSKIYFLTTDNTASASESLMVGLYPYMDVVQIGTTTYGKCYGSITLEDFEEPKRHNWAMQPLVLKYANADGYTDFVSGIPPDYQVEDRLIDAVPFGDYNDPLLAKALEEITGIAPVKKKSLFYEKELIRLPVPRKPVPELEIMLPDREGKTIIF